MDEGRHRFGPFVVYLIIFHLLWICGFLFCVYPWMKSLGDTTLPYALVNTTSRFFIWVLPVFLYLRYLDDVDPMEFLKLRKNWKRGLVTGLVVSVLIFLGSMMRFGAPHPSPRSITWNSVINTSFLIGFFEEIPYRGFILQKLEARVGFWLATLLSSVLFVGIHLPGWISLHLLKLETVLFVFIFGVVMAIVFRYCKSLWGPIITHSLNDCISFILFRV